MRILAIETSCDDTALSVVRCEGGLEGPHFVIEQNVVSSQIEVHRPFGGVVPSLAKREHVKNLPVLTEQIFEESRIKNQESGKEGKIIGDIDAIAVTVGPGLAPALWAGIEFAKDLAKKLDKPLWGANHLLGHIYSVYLPQEIGKVEQREIKFSAVALLVSGGHTILARMDALDKIEKLGETKDDAVGEAFDKVAKMLGLPYPGGPEIQKISEAGDAQAIDFPRPMIGSGDFNFSFSGLKTAVLYYLRKQELKANSYKLKADTAASFQNAAIDILVKKTRGAIEESGAQSLILGGGVAANKLLREELTRMSEEVGVNFYTPSAFVHNTDNAAMIAVAAYIDYLRGVKYAPEAQPNLNL